MRSLIALLFLATLSPAQQECARRNDDGTLLTTTTTGGPNLLIGFQLVAEATYTVSAAQVITGLRSGPASFAIWSHDVGGNRPGVNLSGDGIYTQDSFVAWQGAELPTPVTVTTGQTFWLVWGMPNGSRAPLATSVTTAIPYRGSFDFGGTWNGANSGTQPWPGQPYKFRLYCPRPTNPITAVGTSKPGVVGVPVQTVTGWATAPNELSFILGNAAPAAPAVLFVGTQAHIPLPPIADLYVAPQITLEFLTSGTPGRGAGAAGTALRIPFGAQGFPLATQWLILDSAAVGGVSHTDGAWVVIN